MRSKGFTLFELLVAMALVGLIFTAFLQVFTGTLSQSTLTSARSDLLKEGQIAVQVMASKLQEACYVYPNGKTLRMADSGYSTQNLGGGYDWTVGNDPILAMLLPPDPNSANPDSYRFIAYYPLLRGFYNSNAGSSLQLESDPANDNVWVLMEYRRNLDSAITPGNFASPPGSPASCATLAQGLTNADLQGGTARILVDYVSPQNDLFSTNDNPTDPNDAPTAATLNLRMQRSVQGKSLSVAGGGSGLSVRVFPRNLSVLSP